MYYLIVLSIIFVGNRPLYKLAVVDVGCNIKLKEFFAHLGKHVLIESGLVFQDVLFEKNHSVDPLFQSFESIYNCIFLVGNYWARLGVEAFGVFFHNALVYAHEPLILIVFAFQIVVGAVYLTDFFHHLVHIADFEFVVRHVFGLDFLFTQKPFELVDKVYNREGY